jgi:hypothetical protein
MITLTTLPVPTTRNGMSTLAALTPSDILAMLNAYMVAANGGAAVGTDAVTRAFADALFAYVANRFAVMGELTQAVANAYNNPGSPDTVAQEDDHGSASYEAVDNGVAATPVNPDYHP